MATYGEIMSQARQLHLSGDTEGARRLIAQARQMGTQQPGRAPSATARSQDPHGLNGEPLLGSQTPERQEAAARQAGQQMTPQRPQEGPWTQYQAPRGGLRTFEVEGPAGQRMEVQAVDAQSAAGAVNAMTPEQLAAIAAARKRRQDQAGGAESSGATTYTVEQYRAAARRALEAGDVAAAEELAAAGRRAEGTNPTGSQAVPNGGRSIADAVNGRGMGYDQYRQATGSNQRFDPSVSTAPADLGQMASTAGMTIRDILMGDDDPSTMNIGERTAAALNKAGEAMTLGLVGDEAAGAADALVGRGNYEERRDFYRDQEAQLWDQHPALALGAEIGGSLIGPGKGAAALINRGASTGARIARGAGVGMASGATYGAAEGEGDGRTMGALLGGAMGGAGGAAVVGIGRGFQRASQALSRNPALREAIPTLEGLRETASGLYRAAAESGAILPQASVKGLGATTATALKNAGYNPRLHPRLAVVLDEIDDMATGPQSIQRMDQLRRIARNAAQSVQPDEARLGNIVIDKIDDAIDEMGDGSKALRAAREVWGRMSRLETIEDLIEDAANTPNFEQRLATNVRNLLRNPKRMRGFNEAERQAMKGIAAGTAPVKALHALGKSLSINSIPGVAFTGGAYVAGGPAALALPAIGAGSKAIANALIRSQGNNLRNAVGMSDAQRRIVEALMQMRNPLARAAALPASASANAPDAM